MLIGLLVIHSAWQLVKESVAVLMESTPQHLDAEQIRTALMEIDGVREIHDLHIWAITSGLVALSAHVVIDDDRRQQALLKQLRLAAARAVRHRPRHPATGDAGSVPARSASVAVAACGLAAGLSASRKRDAHRQCYAAPSGWKKTDNKPLIRRWNRVYCKSYP